MSKTKIVFLGNVLGGDDGIGPYLYNELKHHPSLKNYSLFELGVIGFDLISYVEDNDTLIIVDAVVAQSENEIGNVVILKEKDLTPAVSLISQHDFGVEETATILRTYTNIKDMYVIGIKVGSLKSFSNEISPEIKEKLPKIKNKVTRYIMNLAK